MKEKILTKKEIDYIKARCEGCSVAQATKVVGVGLSTGYAWEKRDRIKAEISKGKQQITEQITESISDHFKKELPRYLAEFDKLTESENENIKQNALKYVFDYIKSTSEASKSAKSNDDKDKKNANTIAKEWIKSQGKVIELSS